MKSMPELLTLVKGMVAATRSVGSTLVLLVVFMYVFGIIFTGMMEEFVNADLADLAKHANCPNPESYPGSTCEDRMQELQENFILAYGTISRSMFTLFVGGTLCDDLTNVLRDLFDGTPALGWAMLLFVLLSSFTVLNMLIGVLCEVVSATAENEKENSLTAEVRTRLTKIFGKIDVSGDGQISVKEFE